MVKAKLGESSVVPPFVREFRPEPFSLTKSEWAADNRERAIGTGNRGSAGSTTMFTVPNGKTLYITNSFLSLTNTGGGAAFLVAAINIKGGATGSNDGNIISIQGTNLSTFTGIRQGEHLALSYPMPIKVGANEAVHVTISAAGASVLGGFVGYLE